MALSLCIHKAVEISLVLIAKTILSPFYAITFCLEKSKTIEACMF